MPSTNYGPRGGVHPECVLGHSLGEFAAATCAGILRLEDAIRLVAERSRLVDYLPGGSMLVVKRSHRDVLSLLNDMNLEVAAINSDDQTVVAGVSSEVLKFAEICKEHDFQATVLEATHAFHSSHMDPILEDYNRILETLGGAPEHRADNIPVYISGATGTFLNPSELNSKYWLRHTRNEVNFLKASQTAVQLGCSIFVEIGPQPVLCSLMARNCPSKILCFPSLRRHQGDWSTILHSLGSLYLEGMLINWEGFDRFYSRKKVALPHYPFSRKKYWPERKLGFNMGSPQSPPIHPLLGSPISNPVGLYLFQSVLSLDSTKLEYIKEHRFGPHVNLPGAAYLEMVLAAGVAALTRSTKHLSSPNYPLEVQNLSILAPFKLVEEERYELQTTLTSPPEAVSLVTRSTFNCKIYRSTSTAESSNWVQHVEAMFSLPSGSFMMNERRGGFSLEKFRQLRSTLMEDMTGIYSHLASLGINFGPVFKSLQGIWRDSEDTLVAKVKVPQTHLSQYLLHPILIDALIQAALILERGGSARKALSVPVRIGRFTWIPHEKAGSEDDEGVYVYATRAKVGGGGLMSLYLVNSAGALMAIVENVEFVDSSVKAISGAAALADQQGSPLPEMWEEVWRKTPISWNHSPPNSESRLWIAYKAEGAVCSNLISKLKTLNKVVIEVTPGNKYKLVGEHCYQLRVDEKGDFETLAKSLKSHASVEGILYCWPLDKKLTAQSDLLRPLLYIAQTILTYDYSTTSGGYPRLIAVSSGIVPFEGNDLGHIFPSTIWGFMKSLKNEHPELNCRCVDVTTTESEEGMVPMETLLAELWNDDQDTTILLAGTQRLVPRLQAYKPVSNGMQLAQWTDRFKLILPESKRLADLEFGPLAEYTLGDTDVEIEVRALALNFKDVLNILKPTEEFKDSNAVGMDFSGVIKRIGPQVTRWKKGERVLGVQISNTDPFPSHARISEQAVIRIPFGWTFNDAAAIPVVFCTAYHCLLQVAGLKAGETVLIHTASGGVGLAAINLCRQLGVKVITTAGSSRKRTFLKTLGVEHVFNSRDTNYADSILKVTGGVGVNVVLNSLTSEGFKEASLRVCAKDARFVEMSKLSIWSPEEVHRLREDVTYSVIDLTSFSDEEWIHQIGILQDHLDRGILTPIPYSRFDALNLPDALQYLQTATHIGKVVCVMPELKFDNGVLTASTLMFSDNFTYLITGGLGGIGFEVAKWMLSSGAKHIILSSRSRPSPELEGEIQGLNSTGARLTPAQVDVSDYSQLKTLLDEIRDPELGFPPLRGVMHAAGSLSDGVIAGQSWDKFESVLRPKVDGTLNLHKLIATDRNSHSHPLEHFVTFSSIAASLGCPSQSNYAAGNILQDTLAHYRHSIGLPATTVNWGLWGQVGMGANHEVHGMRSLQPSQGLHALEHVMKTQRVQTCVANMESWTVVTQRVPYLLTYLEQRVWKSELNSGSSTASMKMNQPDQLWNVLDSSGVSKEEKVEEVKGWLGRLVRAVLKQDDESDGIDENTEFSSLGMDSLMLIEMRNRVQSILKDRATLGSSTLREYETVSLLARHLVEIVSGDTDGDGGSTTSMEFCKQFIREESQLAPHITISNQAPAKKIEDIEVILLTGATGFLGSHILQDLAKRRQVRLVYCLVRGQDEHHCNDRLISVLQENKIPAPEIEKIMSQVKVLVGDVRLPHFGLSPQLWTTLASKVEAIIHCAAIIDHVRHLSGAGRQSKDLKEANVDGVKTCLELATSSKVKHVLHSSSFIASVRVGERETELLSECWPEAHDFDDFTTQAYHISKFVGELLMKEAVSRGIPVKVFRFPWIGGHYSGEGRCDVHNNHLLLGFMQMIKMGVVLEDPFPVNILPVDKCVQGSLSIFFHEGAPSDVYNVYHHEPLVVPQLMELSTKFGFRSMEVLPFAQFGKRIAGESSSPFDIFVAYYQEDEKDNFTCQFANSELIRRWMESRETEFFRSRKISRYVPQFYEGLESVEVLIERDLKYCKDTGWFKKFNLY